MSSFLLLFLCFFWQRLPHFVAFLLVGADVDKPSMGAIPNAKLQKIKITKTQKFGVFEAKKRGFICTLL